MNLGGDRKKLILGIPLYGRAFKLTSSGTTGIGAPSQSWGAIKGTYTQEAGYLAYYEVNNL